MEQGRGVAPRAAFDYISILEETLVSTSGGIFVEEDPDDPKSDV
jgi:hypothetical protein